MIDGKVSLSKISLKYVGKNFLEYTCMSFIYSMYRDLGFDVPNQFENLTLDNFVDEFRKDPVKVQFQLVRLSQTIGRYSNPRYPDLCDFLVVWQDKTKTKAFAPGFIAAIYVGKGEAMSSFIRNGVIRFPLDDVHRCVIARNLGYGS